VLAKASGTDYDTEWTAVAGTGDVVGPAGAADGNFAAFDLATGKLIKDSGKSAADFAAASHNHAASAITSGSLAHERGGLEADVSAYSGLLKISGGTTSQITDNSSNWDTAYGWGNHASAGYAPLASPTFTGTVTVPGSNFTVGASLPFADTAGSLTLQNVDALDETTEATIEAAIDTLANLNSIQGVSFTMGAYAATLLNTANEAAFKAAVNLEAGTDFYSVSGADAAFQPLDADLTSIAGLSTTAAGRSALTIADPGVDRVLAWDDSAGAVAPIALADLTAEAAPASGDYLLAYRAEGDLVKVNWSDLPGAGGGISNVVEDTTPQLGGNLDVNGQKIVSVSNGNIDIEPDGTGNVLLGNLAFDADQAVGAGQDNHVLTYDNATGLISLEVAASAPVSSVNGETGAVVLDADDIDDAATTNKFTTSGDISKLAAIEANADVTDAGNVGSAIHGASAKTTPVDADTVPLIDSEASNVLKKVTWANIKATLKTYLDTLYQPVAAALTSWASVTRASGFDTFAATPSSANLKSLITDETGSGGALVFATGPTLTDPVITGAILEDIYQITDGAAFEVDPSNGTIQYITLGAARTPKATNFANGESILLHVNDGSAYTLTWTDATWGGSGVVWEGGSAPTLATSGYTVIALWKFGDQVYGKHVGDVA
jgi:hypothetical protein